MDISQLPSIFFPLCLIRFFLFLYSKLLLPTTATKKDTGENNNDSTDRSNSNNNNNNNKKKQTTSQTQTQTPMLLLILMGGLGLMGILYSLKRKQHISSSNVPMEGCILITGASKGIGRAITLELALRYPSKCFLLTSRKSNPIQDDKDLLKVVNVLKTKLDATNVTIIDKSIDLSKDGSAKLLYDYTTSRNYNVDILILNAGIGSSGKHTDHSLDQTSNMLQVNVVQNTMLLQLYAKDMILANHGGRILIISSVTGAVYGLPNAAMYGATKAYLKSIAWGIAGELIQHNIGVTVSLPGATGDTHFAESSDMSNAVVWDYPLLVSNTANVARQSIDALINGQMEVYPGRFLDGFTIRFVSPFLPPRFLTWFFGMSWEPWPYNFPPGWKKDDGSADACSSSENKEL